ncbi:hypothetical protein SBADM41S_10853 [Streptomyces badius]
MLFGDVTYGGIQRAYLEKVDGEYQGAVFRFTQGLEAGVEPDRRGAGRGDLRRWPRGRQKLEQGEADLRAPEAVPSGDKAFDILAMPAKPGGFQLEYTKPLSEETAAKLGRELSGRAVDVRPDARVRRSEDR